MKADWRERKLAMAAWLVFGLTLVVVGWALKTGFALGLWWDLTWPFLSGYISYEVGMSMMRQHFDFDYS